LLIKALLNIWRFSNYWLKTVPARRGFFLILYIYQSTFMKKALLFTIAFSLHQLALQAQPLTYLVKDICTGTCNGSPQELVAIDGKIYFTANSNAGVELWVTDGVEQNTRLVKDIKPGGSGSNPTNLTPFNGKLYFTADNGITGQELWMSDGTESGTMQVKDINSTQGSGPAELTVFDNKLYFAATDDTHGRELWVSDGTESGTALLKDIGTGANVTGPTLLKVAMGKLFFAQDFNTGKALFVSDGTNGGTLVAQYDVAPQWLTEFNGKLYFSGHTTADGRELWSSDGTQPGTQMLKDIEAGSVGSTPGALHVAGGKLFFTAYTSANGRELWVSDGTEPGTNMVVNANPSATETAITNEVAALNGKLYYSIIDETGVDRLWMSDGTSGGTQRVSADVKRPKQLHVFEGKLYFVAGSSGSQDGYGTQLWRSDGTGQGTAMQLPDALTPADAVGNTSFAAIGNDLYYTAAYSNITGKELWKISAFSAAVAAVGKTAPRIYPNPTTGTVNIQLPIVKDASVKIYSLTGQLLLQQSISEALTTIDVNQLAPGMYITHITTDGHTTIEKLVKH
jgi:ELWxxDGT repeat protein